LPNAQCLKNNPVMNNNASNSDPTQLWNANDNCKALFGDNSIYCSMPGQIWSADGLFLKFDFNELKDHFF